MDFTFGSVGQHVPLELPDELASADNNAVFGGYDSGFGIPSALNFSSANHGDCNVQADLGFVDDPAPYDFAASSGGSELSNGTGLSNANGFMVHGAALVFRSSLEASRFRELSRRRAQLGGIPPAYEVNKGTVVRMLYDAMVSLDEVCDESLETKNFRRGKYSRQEVEAACWRIADILYELHDSSSHNTETEYPEHKGRATQGRLCENLGFEDRLAHICQMLRKRKTACGEALFAEEKLYGIIAAPIAHLKRKATNARSNASKAGRISSYTKLLAVRKESSDDADLLRLLKELT